MSTPVRALVVDDSATARALIGGILAADPGVEVVGEAADGEDAVAKVLALRPSIVVMDIEMPRLGGLEATGRIMAEAPTPIVIVTAKHDPRDVALTLDATRLGALTVLPKPPGPGSPSFDRQAAALVSIVKALSDVKVIGRRNVRPRTPEPVVRSTPAADGRMVRAVGVGASTGGPAALYRFLAAVPRDLPVPVLVVQHITEGFVSGLVRWLGKATSLEVVLATGGQPLAPGVVYVAPDGSHLEPTRDGRVRLGDGPPNSGFRPSVSNLFSALARSYGRDAAAVVLTGMGSDGLDGARAVHAAGGFVLAQDSPTSTVFGMPRAVIDAGLAHFVGPVEAVAHTIASHLPEVQP